MRSITRLAAGGFLAASTMLGLTLASGPAMAQGCTGSSCQEGASVTVQATITEALNPGSFTFNNGQPVTAGGQIGPQQATSSQACPGNWDVTQPNLGTTELCADYVVNVQTGDGNGYVVQASAADLTNGKGGTIGAGNLSIAKLNGDISGGGKASAFTALSNSPATYLSSNGPSASGGDNFPIADELQVPGSANGSYTTELTYTAIAN